MTEFGQIRAPLGESAVLSEIRPKKIVAALSDPQDRLFVRQLLEVIGGYEVLETSDGMGLIKNLKRRPDLILMDTAEKGNFLRALEVIRRASACREVPIAVYSEDQTRLPECTKRGADGFVIKPTAPAIFLGKIWKLLGNEGQQSGNGSDFAEKYKRDLQNIENLPTLPTVYAEVDRLCKNPDVSADELSNVIESDPSITLKLLNLSNSAFFGFTRTIKSVRDAISLLGNQTVNIAIFEATKDLKNSAGLDKNNFWVHSAAVGSVTRFLTKKLKLDREEGFTAGIVHDMGKIVLDALYSDFYGEVLSRVEEANISLYAAEQEVMGLNHSLIGRELAETWNLPPELTEAIAFHHRPARAEKDPEIASLVHLGDAISRKLGAGSGGDATVPEPLPFALKRLNITSEQLTEWEPEMQEAMDADKAILSILKS